MASMSYVMFENTASELAQVTNGMQESCSWEELDLNQYEEQSKKYLYKLCLKYIEEYDRLEESKEFEGEDE
jgi:hypothetical protein